MRPLALSDWWPVTHTGLGASCGTFAVFVFPPPDVECAPGPCLSLSGPPLRPPGNTSENALDCFRQSGVSSCLLKSGSALSPVGDPAPASCTVEEEPEEEKYISREFAHRSAVKASACQAGRAKCIHASASLSHQ